MFKLTALALSLLTLAAPGALATDYFVDAAGVVEYAPGMGSVTQVKDLLDLASTINFQTGDRILLLPGVYRPFDWIDLPDMTVMRTDPGQTGQPVIIDPTAFPASGGYATHGYISYSQPGTGQGTKDLTFEGLSFLNGDYLRGGAFEVYDASPTFRDCTFTNNTATKPSGSTQFARGGAVYISWTYQVGVQVPVSFENCTFDSNHSDDEGGAIFGREASVRILGCSFSSCTAGGSGGAIATMREALIFPWLKCTIDDSTFVGNSAVQTGFLAADGGAISVEGTYVVLSRTSAFIGNTATGAGGAISLPRDSSMGVDQCFFENNSAQSASLGGGAICALQFYGAYLSNSTFHLNQAPLGLGGGVYYDQGSFEWSVYVGVKNCLFESNSARKAGAFNVSSTSPTIDYCTFKDNQASDRFGGLLLANSLMSPASWAIPVARSCIFWGNSAPNGPLHEQQVWSAFASFRAEYCDWQGATAVSPAPTGFIGSSIDQDPSFTSGPLQSFLEQVVTAYLVQSSPCVDTGDWHIAAPIMGTTDPAQAVDGGVPDMGFHYNASPGGLHDVTLSSDTVQASTTGPTLLSIEAGVSAVDRIVFLLGSASGTDQVVPWGGSFLDLVPDPYTNFILTSGSGFFTDYPAGNPISNQVLIPAGTSGSKQVGFQIPSALVPPTPTPVWHAYLIIDLISPGATAQGSTSNSVMHVL